MKHIGYSDDGGVLLEMTEQEYKVWVALSDLANGKSLPYYPTDNIRLNQELDKPMKAIIEWLNVKEKANQLRFIADELDRAIGEKAISHER